MDTALFISALTLGLLGSFHCIGMCGAIALSLPVQHLEGWRKYVGIVLYNIGRVITYGVLGALLGSIGNTFSFFGWQQTLSVVLGVLLVIVCILTITRKRFSQSSWIQKYWNSRLINLIAPLFKNKKLYSPFFIGLLNGLLPCGLVYMAIAGAIATHHTHLGALFMMSFGLGTLPAMLLVGLTGNMISAKWRQLIHKSAPYVIGFMGILLILRGANLNIPYLSPKVEQGKMQCCHQ